ncbi:MAG: hypothetical protein KDI01_02895 [Halioglobus sp.]|nr:hypothetical protein [Halioglobus sp.]
MWDGGERREHSEVEKRLIDLLVYFDEHKETIIERLTSGGVRVREGVAALLLCMSMMMGMVVYLFDQHASQPHANAVHKADFNRAMDGVTRKLETIEAKTERRFESLERKLDRLIEGRGGG